MTISSTNKRTYGRINGQWVTVTTDQNGYNDQVWLTTLVQNLKLNLNESPFYANNGLPALSSVQKFLPPDAYVANIQQQFAQYFSNLSISRVLGAKTPAYDIYAYTHSGAEIFTRIAT